MATKKKRASSAAAKACKATGKTNKLPPDPDGLFKRAAARAKKVMAIYEHLNPGPGRDDLVGNLLHDLMHLCDRDRTLGDFHEGHGLALWLYQDLLAENLCDVGWYNDLETAREAAEQIMFSGVE
jgi:hypothetical protein